jgi:hypothetical protein
LDPIGAKPTKALVCESPEQALSLTLQSPAATGNQNKANCHTIRPNSGAQNAKTVEESQ